MSKVTVTIVGANGFLGRELSSFFKKIGFCVIEIYRFSELDPQINYGTVVFCLGVCIDFQNRIFDTVNAHISKLEFWLREAKFDKFIYLSSTRMYLGQISTCEELEFFTLSKNDVYNQTKFLGETACVTSGRPAVVLRLSNIISYDEESPYFLWSVFRQAVHQKNVHLFETENSTRDYLCLEDLFLVCHKIVDFLSLEGIFNVASGLNLPHKDLREIIKKNINCQWIYGDKKVIYPQINNEKIRDVLGIQFKDCTLKIEEIFSKYIEKKVMS